MQDHTIATATIITLIKFCIETILMMTAAKSMGNIQYPSKHNI